MTTGEGKDWNGMAALMSGEIQAVLGTSSLKPPAAVLPRGQHVFVLYFRVYRR